MFCVYTYSLGVAELTLFEEAFFLAAFEAIITSFDR